MMHTNIEKRLNDLKQLSDTLRLQAKLGKAEARDELEELEKEYSDLLSKVREISKVAGDSAEEIATAAKLGIDANSKADIDAALELAVDELKKGYDGLKDIFKSQ